NKTKFYVRNDIYTPAEQQRMMSLEANRGSRRSGPPTSTSAPTAAQTGTTKKAHILGLGEKFQPSSTSRSSSKEVLEQVTTSTANASYSANARDRMRRPGAATEPFRFGSRPGLYADVHRRRSFLFVDEPEGVGSASENVNGVAGDGGKKGDFYAAYNKDYGSIGENKQSDVVPPSSFSNQETLRDRSLPKQEKTSEGAFVSSSESRKDLDHDPTTNKLPSRHEQYRKVYDFLGYLPKQPTPAQESARRLD
ncbi:unnamed protein product, partial [Amoebophrya sp. A25]